MQDKEFYQQILGLAEPWYVASVNLELEQQHVDVYVEHPRGQR